LYVSFPAFAGGFGTKGTVLEVRLCKKAVTYGQGEESKPSHKPFGKQLLYCVPANENAAETNHFLDES